LNTYYRPLYENRTSKFRQEIEHKKVEFELMTGKRHTDIGSLMMVMRQSNVLYGKLTGIKSPWEEESDPGSRKGEDKHNNGVEIINIKRSKIPSCKKRYTLFNSRS
jgi:hypothetical protein